MQAKTGNMRSGLLVPGTLNFTQEKDIALEGGEKKDLRAKQTNKQ